ncbi:MAG TPA: FeoA family protein [Puia sp.]|nr:FeoA family protein [Puia sp.]
MNNLSLPSSFRLKPFIRKSNLMSVFVALPGISKSRKKNDGEELRFAAMLKRLSDIEVGSTVVIKSFENNDIFLKLMEMGCVPGELIKVEQVAPLGDPIAIIVSGYNLSLRLDEARNIFVEEMIDNN